MDKNQALLAWQNRINLGDRNIALSNVGYPACQQKYLMAILGYLRSKAEFQGKRIGLVSFDLQSGIYKNYHSNLLSKNALALSAVNSLGSDFINWHTLMERNVPTDFLDEYDLLLWDLPDLNFLNNHSEKLINYFKVFDSMLIVSHRPNGINDRDYIKRIEDFYNNHGLPLPRLVESESGFGTKSFKMVEVLKNLTGL